MSQFYGPGPVMADNVDELDVVTYRGDRFTVGRTEDDELERLIPTGGAQGEIYRKLSDLRERDVTGVTVPYPDALVPQAWAAGAPLMALRTLLGLDAVGGKLRSSPHLPEGFGRVRLRGLKVAGGRADVSS